MYARVVAFEQATVSSADELVETVRARSRSTRAEVPDVQALLVLVDPDHTRALGLSFFESEQAIREAEPSFEKIGDEGPEETRGRRLSVDVYEVVRHEGGEGAKAARISSFESPADKIDEAVRRTERAEAMAPFNDVLPPAAEMRGWKGYYWLADRVKGRTKMITLFDSLEALETSASRADELRLQAARTSGDTITGVDHYEVVLSDHFAGR